MSGHTSFTFWINKNANYILVNKEKEFIKETFFTSDDIHNSDTFNIKTNKGCYELGDNRIDFTDLKSRYGN